MLLKKMSLKVLENCGMSGLVWKDWEGRGTGMYQVSAVCQVL